MMKCPDLFFEGCKQSACVSAGRDLGVSFQRHRKVRDFFRNVSGGGGLEDVAQALHDAPDIADKIRVYWIGGPNKKWSTNSYAYIVENFPDLWMIEDNASYRGFIAQNKVADKYNAGFYDEYLSGAGYIGADFLSCYKGIPKMGDTPALLYVMDGDPDDPQGESWGGYYLGNGDLEG